MSYGVNDFEDAMIVVFWVCVKQKTPKTNKKWHKCGFPLDYWYYDNDGDEN